jgi:hypothetical protein
LEIAANGFDIKRAGNGRFGRGLYFTDSPEKALRYGTTILVVDVDLGRCKRYALCSATSRQRITVFFIVASPQGRRNPSF